MSFSIFQKLRSFPKFENPELSQVGNISELPQVGKYDCFQVGNISELCQLQKRFRNIRNFGSFFSHFPKTSELPQVGKDFWVIETLSVCQVGNILDICLLRKYFRISEPFWSRGFLTSERFGVFQTVELANFQNLWNFFRLWKIFGFSEL